MTRVQLTDRGFKSLYRLHPEHLRLGFNSDFGRTTRDDGYLSSAGHIDTARCNQPNTNPGNKRGQGTEEEVTKCDCRHNLDVGEWCERRSFGIGEGVHQQHLIYRTRQN